MRSEVAYYLDEIDACKNIRLDTDNQKIKNKCTNIITKYRKLLKDIGYKGKI